MFLWVTARISTYNSDIVESFLRETGQERRFFLGENQRWSSEEIENNTENLARSVPLLGLADGEEAYI